MATSLRMPSIRQAVASSHNSGTPVPSRTPELLDGAQPVSASNVDPGQISVTRMGRKPTVAPRPLTKQEIQVTVADFARAARNAMEAGFDGVQILANYLYLISQFLNATTNLRKDEYGGSLKNRSRFLFEVVESVLDEVRRTTGWSEDQPDARRRCISSQRRNSARRRICNSEAELLQLVALVAYWAVPPTSLVRHLRN